jgi:hypothetical protein
LAGKANATPHQEFDNPPKFAILCATEMNTTFAKYIKTHAPVMATMTKWQRCSRIPGNVGTKF